MRLLAFMLSILLLLCPVSAVAGCGPWPEWTYYDYNDANGTVWIYAGVTTIPALPADANKVTLEGFNFPSWIVPRATSEAVTFVQRAAECNIPVSEIKVVSPPDCNERSITSYGDPNTFYLYRLALDYSRPKSGTYTGFVRLMDNGGTSEAEVRIVFNARGVRFFVKPYKNRK